MWGRNVAPFVVVVVRQRQEDDGRGHVHAHGDGVDDDDGFRPHDGSIAANGGNNTSACQSRGSQNGGESKGPTHSVFLQRFSEFAT